MTGAELAQFGSTTDQPSQANVGGDLPPIDSETAWAYPTSIKTYNYDVDHTNIIEYDSSKSPGSVLWQFRMNPRALSTMSRVFKAAIQDHMYWSLDTIRYSLVTLNAPTTSGGAWAFHYNLNPRRVIASKTDMWKHSPHVKMAKFRDDHSGVIEVAKDLYVPSPWRTTDSDNDDPWRTSFGSIVMILVGLPSDPLQSARYQLSYSFTFRVCYRQLVNPGELDVKEYYPPGPVWLDDSFSKGTMSISTAGTMAAKLEITWTESEDIELDLSWNTGESLVGTLYFPNPPEIHVDYEETVVNPEDPGDGSGGDGNGTEGELSYPTTGYQRTSSITQTQRHNIGEANCTVSKANGVHTITIFFTVAPPRNMVPDKAGYHTVEQNVYPVFNYPSTIKPVRQMVAQDYNSATITLQSFDLSALSYKRHYFQSVLPLKYKKPKPIKKIMPTIQFMKDNSWYFTEFCTEHGCPCRGKSHNTFNPKPWNDMTRRLFYDKLTRSKNKTCSECNHEPCIQQELCWALCDKCRKPECACTKGQDNR